MLKVVFVGIITCTLLKWAALETTCLPLVSAAMEALLILLGLVLAMMLQKYAHCLDTDDQWYSSYVAGLSYLDVKLHESKRRFVGAEYDNADSAQQDRIRSEVLDKFRLDSADNFCLCVICLRLAAIHDPATHITTRIRFILDTNTMKENQA